MSVCPGVRLVTLIPLMVGLAVLRLYAVAGDGPTAKAGPTSRVSDQNRIVWPAPPAAARVRFVRSLDPASVKGAPSLLTKLWRVLVGASEETRMQQPYGIAVGSDKKVYVADTFGGAIHVYDLAKPGHSTINVKGQSLIGIAAEAGRLFVTDSLAGTVTGLDLKGHALWTLGHKAGFVRPTGVVSAGSRLYVVDTMRHCVSIVSSAGILLGSFGAQGDQPGQFNFPTNIARGPDGRLYVTDAMNFRIQIFDTEGKFLGTFGKLGDGAGDFDKPKGVAVDSDGHVYVVEGLNDVVQIFESSGRLLLAFGGSGSGPGQFWLPSGIAIVGDSIYVADSANRRLQVFEYLKAPQ